MANESILEEMIGQRFGKLVVVERAENNKRGNAQYLCKCDCGNEIVALGANLRNGNTKSCGCLKSEAPYKDLTGQRFGRLVVIRRAENDSHNQVQYLCKCDCGNEKVISAQHLRKGHTKSCGCLRVELGREKRTHGLTNTRLYSIWSGMKDRCHNPNSKYWDRYGGRGIHVCDEWRTDFMNFYHWAMDNGYDDELTLDRIDNSKGYSPDNCRWATWETQENNRTNNVRFTINGNTHTVAEWAKIFGITRDRLQDLIDRRAI